MLLLYSESDQSDQDPASNAENVECRVAFSRKNAYRNKMFSNIENVFRFVNVIILDQLNLYYTKYRFATT